MLYVNSSKGSILEGDVMLVAQDFQNGAPPAHVPDHSARPHAPTPPRPVSALRGRV